MKIMKFNAKLDTRGSLLSKDTLSRDTLFIHENRKLFRGFTFYKKGKFGSYKMYAYSFFEDDVLKTVRQYGIFEKKKILGLFNNKYSFFYIPVEVSVKRI